MIQDTWAARDLPVLEAIVERFDAAANGALDVRPKGIAKLVPVTERDAGAAIKALSDARYIDGTAYAGGIVINFVSAKARRAVGTWPTPETLADRLVQGMQQAAEAEPDEEKRGKLRRAASHLGSVGRDVLVEVMGAAISRGAGVG